MESKTFEPGDSVMYVSPHLLKGDTLDVTQYDEMLDLQAIALAGGQGVELGFVEQSRQGGAMCRFFRVDRGALVLRNTTNAEYARADSLVRWNHRATSQIAEILARIQAQPAQQAEEIQPAEQGEGGHE